MNWNNILRIWENGDILNNPVYSSPTERWLWNTSVLKNNGNVPFVQSFKVEKNNLPNKQNKEPFEKYFSNNKYAVSFLNLNKNTMLVAPTPRQSKNYATLSDFINNATKLQQRNFWKEVAKTSRFFMKKYKSVWISTSGLNVPYCHVRISKYPKYYFDNKLKLK